MCDTEINNESTGSISNLVEHKQETNNKIEDNDIIKKWDELNLDSNILRGIYSHGFETPSPIQAKGIIPIMNGKDLIAQAQSGTGKTATFVIGALSRINFQETNVQAMILVPTRELATPINDVI